MTIMMMMLTTYFPPPRRRRSVRKADSPSSYINKHHSVNVMMVAISFSLRSRSCSITYVLNVNKSCIYVHVYCFQTIPVRISPLPDYIWNFPYMSVVRTRIWKFQMEMFHLFSNEISRRFGQSLLTSIKNYHIYGNFHLSSKRIFPYNLANFNRIPNEIFGIYAYGYFDNNLKIPTRMFFTLLQMEFSIHVRRAYLDENIKIPTGSSISFVQPAQLDTNMKFYMKFAVHFPTLLREIFSHCS